MNRELDGPEPVEVDFTAAYYDATGNPLNPRLRNLCKAYRVLLSDVTRLLQCCGDIQLKREIRARLNGETNA